MGLGEIPPYLHNLYFIHSRLGKYRVLKTRDFHNLRKASCHV